MHAYLTSPRDQNRALQREIGLRSLTKAIDTTTSSGRLIFHIFGVRAEFERGMIRERTCAGLDAALARSRVGRRPPVLSVKDISVAEVLLVIRRSSSSRWRSVSASCPRRFATCLAGDAG